MRLACNYRSWNGKSKQSALLKTSKLASKTDSAKPDDFFCAFSFETFCPLQNTLMRVINLSLLSKVMQQDETGKKVS
jgi:hypothetical protein